MADLEGDTSDDDPPPALIEDNLHPVRIYGDQSVITLRVKRSSFDTYVGQRQWAFVELELTTSDLAWGPTLEQSVGGGILWVVSAAQERRDSRQLMTGETMDRDLTRGPYTQHFEEECIYCCTPSVWGSVGIYINNRDGNGMTVHELLRPMGRIFLLHDWHHWDIRWGNYVEPDNLVVEDVMNNQW